MSEKVASDFIKKNILKMHTHIVNKQNKQLIDPNFNYIYLLNERYEISSLLTNYRRKYEIIGKKIYLHCNKTSDKLFLIKKILLQYCQNVIPNMFTKWEKRMNLKANLSFK
jgi:hypothetical protein